MTTHLTIEDLRELAARLGQQARDSATKAGEMADSDARSTEAMFALIHLSALQMIGSILADGFALVAEEIRRDSL